MDWEKKGININGERLNHLRSADDVVLVSESPEEIQSMLEELKRKSEEIVLKINPRKSKLMNNCDNIQQLTVDNMQIDTVNECV